MKELALQVAVTAAGVYIGVVLAHATNEYMIKPHAEKTLAAK